MSELTEALRNMSIQDLHGLEKLVAEEKKRREEEIVYKCDMKIYSRLKEFLEKDLIDNGVSATSKYSSIGEVGFILNHVQDYIYYICDVSLGNYTITKAKGHGGSTISRNGKALSYTIDPNEYRSMAFELMDVMEKYIKEKEKSK